MMVRSTAQRKYDIASASPVDNSASGRQEGPEEENYLKIRNAVLYITEGEKNDVLQHPHDELGVLSYYIIHNPVYCFAHLITTILLILLALVEKPTVFPFEEVILIHAPIEIILLLLLALDIILRVMWLRERFFTNRTVLIALLLAVMFVEATVVIKHHQSHVRVTRALRPFFFIDTYLMSVTRRTFQNIFKCIMEILDVLVVLLFMIVIFALMGYYLFAQNSPDYFSTVEQSFVSLFITLTTANHPDVMLESYNLSGWNAVFYIIFLMITLYLLTNVLLGVVYGSFTHASKKKFKKKFKHQREALEKAYNELPKDNGLLSTGTFLKLMSEYKPLMPKWQVLCTFKALQEIDVKVKAAQNGSSLMPDGVELTLEQFYNLYEALDFKWIPPLDYKWILPETKSKCSFKSIQDCLLYCTEILLKIIARGWKYFTILNWIDMAIINSSLVMLCLETNCCAFIFYRPVKLIRLLWLKGRYRKIMKAIEFLMGKIISAVLLLLVVYYCFAIIGMEVFSGLVESKCCDYNHTWYGIGEYYSGTTNTTTTNVYWLLNFHTNILNTFATLFVLMVVNNWYIVMEGFAAEVQHLRSVPYAWLTRIYFMSFYIITLVVLQVSVAFILDAFASTRKIRKLLSKKSRTDKTESKCSIVNAYYGSLRIFLTCQQVKDQDEDPPEVWCKHIAHHIKTSRRIHIQDQKPEYKRITKSKQHVLQEGYYCKGKRERGKGCLDVQLYCDKFSKWMKQFKKEPKDQKDGCRKCTEKCLKDSLKFIFE